MRCDQTTQPTIKRYLWKDDIHIFLKTPLGLKYAHLLGHNGLGKIMAPCGQMQKLSYMSISSGLSLIYSRPKGEGL